MTLDFSTCAFGSLTLALLLLRAPRYCWTIPCIVSLALALPGGLIDLRGLLVLVAFAGVCLAAARADHRVLLTAATALMLALCAGLFLHVLPGFHNPRVVNAVVLGPGSLAYSEYLNVDKGMAGLFLLGIYAPSYTQRRPAPPRRFIGAFAWRFALMVAVVITLSLVFGYVRWDPKLPSWWPIWLWAMVFLTALPEEALFRAVLQSSIERWLGSSSHATAIAVVAAGMVFGVAHLAGGPLYVVLASVAGMGYGWIYASTRSIAAAVAAHAGLNAVHFFLFSYPALERTF